MLTHSLEPMIRKHPFFQGLEDRHIQLVVSCARNVRFEPEELLFREGEAAEQFYLIREGLVAVQVLVPQRGYLTVETVSTGEVLGWSWLFPPYRWRFTARIQQPTLALAFDGKCLRGKCEEDHDLGYELMKRFSRIIIERLQGTRLRLLDLYGINA